MVRRAAGWGAQRRPGGRPPVASPDAGRKSRRPGVRGGRRRRRAGGGGARPVLPVGGADNWTLSAVICRQGFDSVGVQALPTPRTAAPDGFPTSPGPPAAERPAAARPRRVARATPTPPVRLRPACWADQRRRCRGAGCHPRRASGEGRPRHPAANAYARMARDPRRRTHAAPSVPGAPVEPPSRRAARHRCGGLPRQRYGNNP